MKEIINLFFNLTNHISDNLSNYLLSIGVLLVLAFIYISYGIPSTILATGVSLIITSVIVELNRSKRRR